MPPIRRVIQAAAGPLSSLARMIDEIHPSRTSSDYWDPLSEAEAASLVDLLPGADILHRPRDSNLTVAPLTVDEMLALGTTDDSADDHIWKLLGDISDAAYSKASDDVAQTGIPLDAAMKLLRQSEDFEQFFYDDGPSNYISNLRQSLNLGSLADIVEGPLSAPARRAKSYLADRLSRDPRR